MPVRAPVATIGFMSCPEIAVASVMFTECTAMPGVELERVDDERDDESHEQHVSPPKTNACVCTGTYRDVHASDDNNLCGSDTALYTKP